MKYIHAYTVITDDHQQSQLNGFFLFHGAGLLCFGFNRTYNNQHKMASSDGKYSSAKMKPIPQWHNHLRNSRTKSRRCPYLRPNAEPSPRAKLCYFMTASRQIKRSPCYTSILLVGVTGVGKSSTVNHLLNTNLMQLNLRRNMILDRQQEIRLNSFSQLTNPNLKFQMYNCVLWILLGSVIL